jgi:hypothetical protein
MAFGMPDLRLIAERIGAPTARAKEDIAASIVARAQEQGLGYAGYASNLPQTGGPEVDVKPISTEEPSSPNVETHPGSEDVLSSKDVEAIAYNTRIKHFMFTIGDGPEPDPMIGLLDVDSADAEISRFLAQGYEPLEVFVGGFDIRGHRVGWVLEKGGNDDEARYSEAHHVLRTLTGNPDTIRGTVTGFQADAFISNMLDDGWKLVGVKFNGIDAGPSGGSGGIYMIWFLVR